MTTKKGKIDEIECDVARLKAELLDKKPEKFSARDIVQAFFGALFIGVTFVFSGRLFEVTKQTNTFHLFMIIVSTIVILIAEIYFIGWSRIKNAKEKGRNVFEFTLKRLVVVYAVSIAVALFYSYVLGYNSILSDSEMIRLVFLVAMPCSIGAAIADLLKKY